ncbi:hypothetical protein ACEPAH_9318 [Sanghuangporus vaninii]
MSLNDGNKDGSSSPTAEYPGLKFGLRRAENTFYRRRERTPPRGRAQGATRMNAVDNNGTGNSSPREWSAASHTRRDSTHEESDTRRDSRIEHARAPSPVKPKPNTRPLSPSPLGDGSTPKAAEGQSKATRSDSHRGRRIDNANDGGDSSPRRLLSPGRFVESPVGSPRKGRIPALDDGVDRGSGHKFPRLPDPTVPLGTSLDLRPSVSSPLRKETPASLIMGKPFSADSSQQQDLQNKGTAGRRKNRSVQSAPPPLPERHRPAPPPAPESTPKRPTSSPRGTPRFTEDFHHEFKDFKSSIVPTSASGAEKKEKGSIWERIGARNAEDEKARDEKARDEEEDRMKPRRLGISKYFETRSPNDRHETLLGSSDI